jgi:Glycosyl transferase family 2
MSDTAPGSGPRAAADVAICIPAYQAEAFIDRTLWCARRQTYANLKILVSVDLSTDDTVAICQKHARDDARIQVFAQSERQGWAKNVNFLLDRVDTEFFFLYFHDDIIEPIYVEELLKPLLARPDAMSAYCTVDFFGAEPGSAGRRPSSHAHSFEGTALERLITLLISRDRGLPLRALTRSRLLTAGLRFFADAEAGFWVHNMYLMELLAAGPMLAVAAPLYKHWAAREGGLVKGWWGLPVERLFEAFRVLMPPTIKIVNGATQPGPERRLLLFCVYLLVMRDVRGIEKRAGVEIPADGGEIYPAFADLSLPGLVDTIDPTRRDLILTEYRKLLLDDGRSALLRGDTKAALARFAGVAALEPDRPRAWWLLSKVLDAQGYPATRRLLVRQAKRLQAAVDAKNRQG